MEQPIKFRVKNQDDPFYKELKQQVSAFLRTQPNGRYGNGIILLKAVLFLSMYWGAYFLILFGSLPTGALLALYASLGISGLFVAFNLSHDEAHDSLSKYKLLNQVLYYLTFNALGANAY